MMTRLDSLPCYESLSSPVLDVSDRSSATQTGITPVPESLELVRQIQARLDFISTQLGSYVIRISINV
jgi:hypothetical protein